ncbi:MAG: VCBS repeat-containing protein [Planctomycetes bacterium]|nr:VCBS repeat-containing protein [Planctomycetota bacterium]
METIPVHEGPWFVEWADLNGDGWTDLAALAIGIRSKLAIMLNDGIGRLITQEETPPRFGISSFPWIGPTSVAAADLDGDGDQDLAVAISAWDEPSTVIVMFNDGEGVFDPVVPHLLGPVMESSAEHVVIADLNGDGVLDLAVADATDQGGNRREGKVWILLGQGAGRFAAPTPFVISGLLPKHIAIGDLDGDQDQDLVVWTAEFRPKINTTLVGRVAVVLSNDGNGSFTESGRYSLGSFTWTPTGSVALGDFDQDGDLDFVGTATPRPLLNNLEPPGVVTFFLNDGQGVFTTLMQREMIRPMGLTLADFDADGHDDVAVLSPNVTVYGKPCLNIIYGLGGGAFSDPVPQVDEHLTSARITHGDVDGDGDIDLIVPNDYGTVIVNLNRGDGCFDRGVHYGVGSVPRDAAVADFDGDGRIDIVTSNLFDHNITLLRNLGCPRCYADCDQSTGRGVLDLRDFLCFQTAFTSADPYACDCDTSTGQSVCDIFDFLCFQNAFVAGCP